MDRQIEKARQVENLPVTIVSREHIINLKGQILDLTKKISELTEEVARSSQEASVMELQRDEAFAQLSSLEDIYRQCDETLAHVAVLQQELNK